jgi:YesN/AraC family two-component response regulator
MDSPARILMADDEELFLLSTADLLREEGYLVDCARDGQEAARMLAETSYDLLISDIRMPGNAGLSLIQDLPEPNRDLPVILVTGYPSAETAIQAVNRAVLAYLVKPMEFRDLVAQVQRGVAQCRVQRAVSASARRIQDWAGEMAALAGGPGGAPVQQVLGAMLGRMGESLLDLKHLVDLSSGLTPDGQACQVQHCPRVEAYQRIFHEGIAILEQTKGAFKSRNLEDLRHKMEGAVENFPS